MAGGTYTDIKKHQIKVKDGKNDQNKRQQRRNANMNKEIEISKITPVEKRQDYKQSCLDEIKVILATEMKEPLSKTGIYTKHLTHRRIPGLSTAAYYAVYFNILLEDGSLRELPDRKGRYEYIHEIS